MTILVQNRTFATKKVYGTDVADDVKQKKIDSSSDKKVFSVFFVFMAYIGIFAIYFFPFHNFEYGKYVAARELIGYKETAYNLPDIVKLIIFIVLLVILFITVLIVLMIIGGVVNCYYIIMK